ncbi:hypothetical protein EPUS_07317 [Endocarpon pusillum Z07020]|uniref:Mtf2-like C-terminal domain-containing protein n=1 Tax=Endocarpon pusillum (strain Z07020 / HMAS-L-300199) TaxID=1263415 RepID=U1GFL2_ENDPU|nr:uncharacterized protein EPUS_07317 [Endocarpon pusillum Z07020]ERF76437.1 hypothetical protein EPUS_07317 [Endocarpon pusillum Z07020]
MKAVQTPTWLRAEALQHLPFLYCTRTILGGRQRGRRPQGYGTFSTATHLHQIEDGVTEKEVQMLKPKTQEERGNYFQEKLAHQSKEQGKQQDQMKKSSQPVGASKKLGKGNTSTMTAAERQVFKKIFQEIATGSGRDKTKASPLPEQKTPLSTDYREIFSLFSSAASEEGSGQNKKGAAQATSIGGQSSPAGGGRQASQTLSEQDREHIQKYPERLRKIASRATLLAKAEPQNGMSKEFEEHQNDFFAAESEFAEASAVQKRHVDSICVEQMKNISEQLIEAAKVDDGQLWLTCEKLVLPLLAFLEEDPSRPSTNPATGSSPAYGTATSSQGTEQHLASPPEPEYSFTMNPNARRQQRNLQMKAPNQPRIEPSTSTSTSTSKTNPTTPFHIPPTIPSLPIISTLYPALLLLTLRLLTTHYPLSHYPSTLLPRIRSLGLRSYVLGTSTQLYNTLLLHRWSVYSDLPTMDRLLHEMERGGIDFDAETISIIERAAVDERKWKAEAMSKLQGLSRKARSKILMKKGPLGGQAEGASAGKRATAWWEAEVTLKWFERITATEGWRRVRERRVGGAEAVVEREYAGSIAGGEVEMEPRVMLG